ncbi:oxidation resistance protein 1 isoform X1 [Brassica rapa]|uniref:oxidation resistance protein 1 isoform X1 n=1 Tax=Brassica campestris TaxID=3711 RepID=UPI00142D27E0|nr:oxidation resistance protein 1 isoform X1 [Brassica rapa]
MGKKQKSSSSLRSKAVHFVTDLTTGLLNPISAPPPLPDEEEDESKRDQLESKDEPDTSSFSAFLGSLLSSQDQEEEEAESSDTSSSSSSSMKETSVAKKSLLSKYKQHFKNFYQAVKLSKDRKPLSGNTVEDNGLELEMKQMQDKDDTATTAILIPDISEPSLLLTDLSRRSLYSSLPALVQGRKWILLYSTWRHGISLSTLYRKSLLWPGLSLLVNSKHVWFHFVIYRQNQCWFQVVGDRKGSVFGGLVEAPLIPTDKKYQGTNSTFVFTDKSGQPTIYRPTGANRFYTLCSKDFLALGGGGRFALYLDSELLSGSSAYSETYGNACLATSQDFDVKEVELWGFVYGSKYDEILALSKTTEPGVCRW